MSSVFETANQLLADHVRGNPGDRRAAKNVIEEIRTLSVEPRQIELSGLEAAMQQIVAEFKKGSREYLEKMKTLTSEIMRNIASTLRTQMNNPMKLQGVTPEMMVDAVMANLADAELTDEQRGALRAAMLPLFTRPQEPAAKTGDQPRRCLPSGTKP
jgi:methyltransferase-like protein